MHYPANVSNTVYLYDGSFPGFLCCVFESYRRRELPSAIQSSQGEQTTLFAPTPIPTQQVRARRVYAGIRRLGPQVSDRLTTAFLSSDPDKERILLLFLRRAFEVGPGVVRMLGDPDVAGAWNLERAVRNEAHLFLEFLRFEQRDNLLGAVIHPKNLVLPLLRDHFCSRLPDDDFLIYDATHGVAMFRQGNTVRYLAMQGYTPAPDAGEECWKTLWRRFFQALTIEQRRNERCQRTHCPKRFWPDMWEMPSDTVSDAGLLQG